MIRLVLDTNVFVSGIFWSGPPYKILQAWQKSEISLEVKIADGLQVDFSYLKDVFEMLKDEAYFKKV
jgi:predicted nucleic acid-binding protein